MTRDPTPPGRPAAPKAPGGALFSFGFRPFFLLAVLFSPLALAMWLGVYSGHVVPTAAFVPAQWHAHEMLFGFAVAVAAGFFLTAVPNWTGAPPIRGWPLMVLAAVWLLGRAAMWGAPVVPVSVAAVVDFAFVPFLAGAIFPALVGARRRNLVFLVLLALLAAGNLLFHLEALGLAATGSRGLLLAVDTFAVLIAVIGGRVTPAFTQNALKAGHPDDPTAEIAPRVWLGEAAILSVAAMLLADLFAGPGLWSGILALLAAAVNAVRLGGWKTHRVVGQPILWVLHLGYAWLVVGLAVKGWADLTGGLPASAALHGITIGAIGTMTLAMMTRASLGHTGRPLVAGAAATAAYVLVSVAVIVRLAVPVAVPGQYGPSVMVSGIAWVIAFVVFAAAFWPVLTRPRANSPSPPGR